MHTKPFNVPGTRICTWTGAVSFQHLPSLLKDAVDGSAQAMSAVMEAGHSVTLYCVCTLALESHCLMFNLEDFLCAAILPVQRAWTLQPRRLPADKPRHRYSFKDSARILHSLTQAHRTWIEQRSHSMMKVPWDFP